VRVPGVLPLPRTRPGQLLHKSSYFKSLDARLVNFRKGQGALCGRSEFPGEPVI
jgi:hypothetical protein